MKKIMTWVIFCFLLLSLAACGEKKSTSNSSSLTKRADVRDENEKKPSIEKTEEDTKPDSKDGRDQGAAGSAAAQAGKQQEITFEEITIVDNEHCAVKITGIEPDGLWGYTLKVYMENKSPDKALLFSVVSAAVDGVQTDPFFASEVAAGKKAKDEISFSDSALSDNGIDVFTDIEMSFQVSDANDWLADNLAEVTAHVFPLGEEKASLFVREQKSTDTVLVDNEDVSVIVTGYREDEIWGYTADLFIVNKTEKELMVSADEVSVNGFMADPFWATPVIPGKMKFASISWSDSVFAENDISAVEEIEMTLRIYNADDWLEEDLFKEAVTLRP